MLNRPYEVIFYYERPTGQQKHSQETGFNQFCWGDDIYILLCIGFCMNIGSAKMGYNSLQAAIIRAYLSFIMILILSS